MSTSPAIDQRPFRPEFESDYRRSNGAPTRAPVPLGASRDAVRVAWRLSLPIVAGVTLRVLPGIAKIAAWAWASFYALLGRRQAIMAFALIWLCNMFTHALGYPPGGATIFRHGTNFAAALSVFVLHAAAPPRSRTPVLLWWTGGMSLLVILHSIFFSTMVDVSVLKAISFGLVIQTLLTAWSRLSPLERAVTENQVWGLFYAITILSVPLIALPAGYIRTGSGFQGILEHPQLFGQVSAIGAVWLLATWLTDPKMRLSLKLLLPILLTNIFLSRTRGGLLMFVVGSAAALAAGPIAAAMSRVARAPRVLKRRLALVICGSVIVMAIAGPTVSESFQEFIRKTGKSTSAVDAAWAARGFMVERMRQNIAEFPFTGIGFGVPSEPELMYALVRDPIFGLPVMATVEKGVLPVAMVEEMGWPLALMWAPWFLTLFLKAVRAGPRYAGVCAAALVVNLSEAVFFSPGGGGLMFQLLVAMAATAPPLAKDFPTIRGYVR